MLVLKNARQIKWPDLKHIEDPFHAKNTLASNMFRQSGGEQIVNEGGFNLPKHNHQGFEPLSDITFKLQTGQAFLVSLTTRFPLLTNIQKDSDDQVTWQFKSPHQHPMLQNSLYGVFNHIETPGRYVASPEVKIEEPTHQQKDKKVEEKHQFKITYTLEAGATNHENYEVKLSVMNESKQRICMAQVMDVMSANSNGEVTSKIFKLEKGDTFSVYPVREYMSDVRKDFSDNKSYKVSEINKRIKALTVEPPVLINGVHVHSINIKIPPILRMGCFFDGTGNDDSNSIKYSNVYKLSDSYRSAVLGKPHSYQNYIRGVGTEGDGGFEKFMGSIAGFGALDRVAGMLFELEQACLMYLKEYEIYPEEIHLDVFGFSRGATTARHFMNVLKQGFYGFNDQAMQTYISPNIIQFSFVGLFDSVGSYGLAGDNHDTGYNFNINKKWITKDGQVVHLIALNEYRYNFDLQTIFLDQNPHYPEDKIIDKRREIGLIGAHSDVGGSYLPNEQGVINTHINPTQLSVMALQIMYDFAKQYNVPLARLEIPTIEPELEQHYELVRQVLLEPKTKTLWMQWAGHKKYKRVLQYYIKKSQQLLDASDTGKQNPYPQGREVRLAQLQRQLKGTQTSINHLEQKLHGLLNDDFIEFKQSYEYLDEYYIHESHGPFNDSLFMGAEKEDGLIGGQQLRRTVYFKEAKNFKYENKQADRVAYKDGRREVIDIDEFKFVMAKEFH